MEIGMIGLGRMGSNMVRRLHAAGHRCVVFDTSADAVAALAGELEGVAGSDSMAGLAATLAPPRAVWVMVPAGVTDAVTDDLAAHLDAGDTIIDGGNSRWVDGLARARSLESSGIAHCDVGTSGGVFGLDRGYCLMVGGPDDGGRAAGPGVRRAGPRLRRRASHPGTVRRSRPGRARVAALRSGRCGPLREDGPQRHRVRDHGGVRGGARAPGARGTRDPGPPPSTPRPRRWRIRRRISTTSTSRRSARSGAAAA